MSRESRAASSWWMYLRASEGYDGRDLKSCCEQFRDRRMYFQLTCRTAYSRFQSQFVQSRAHRHSSQSQARKTPSCSRIISPWALFRSARKKFGDSSGRADCQRVNHGNGNDHNRIFSRARAHLGREAAAGSLLIRRGVVHVQ